MLIRTHLPFHHIPILIAISTIWEHSCRSHSGGAFSQGEHVPSTIVQSPGRTSPPESDPFSSTSMNWFSAVKALGGSRLGIDIPDQPHASREKVVQLASISARRVAHPKGPRSPGPERWADRFARRSSRRGKRSQRITQMSAARTWVRQEFHGRSPPAIVPTLWIFRNSPSDVVDPAA